MHWKCSKHAIKILIYAILKYETTIIIDGVEGGILCNAWKCAAVIIMVIIN